eukprot:CFRG6368T1
MPETASGFSVEGSERHVVGRRIPQINTAIDFDSRRYVHSKRKSSSPRTINGSVEQDASCTCSAEPSPQMLENDSKQTQTWVKRLKKNVQRWLGKTSKRKQRKNLVESESCGTFMPKKVATDHSNISAQLTRAHSAPNHTQVRAIVACDNGRECSRNTSAPDIRLNSLDYNRWYEKAHDIVYPGQGTVNPSVYSCRFFGSFSPHLAAHRSRSFESANHGFTPPPRYGSPRLGSPRYNEMNPLQSGSGFISNTRHSFNGINNRRLSHQVLSGPPLTPRRQHNGTPRGMQAHAGFSNSPKSDGHPSVMRTQSHDGQVGKREGSLRRLSGGNTPHGIWPARSTSIPIRVSGFQYSPSTMASASAEAYFKRQVRTGSSDSTSNQLGDRSPTRKYHRGAAQQTSSSRSSVSKPNSSSQKDISCAVSSFVPITSIHSNTSYSGAISNFNEAHQAQQARCTFISSGGFQGSCNNPQHRNQRAFSPIGRPKSQLVESAILNRRLSYESARQLQRWQTDPRRSSKVDIAHSQSPSMSPSSSSNNISPSSLTRLIAKDPICTNSGSQKARKVNSMSCANVELASSNSVTFLTRGSNSVSPGRCRSVSTPSFHHTNLQLDSPISSPHTSTAVTRGDGLSSPQVLLSSSHTTNSTSCTSLAVSSVVFTAPVSLVHQSSVINPISTKFEHWLDTSSNMTVPPSGRESSLSLLPTYLQQTGLTRPRSFGEPRQNRTNCGHNQNFSVIDSATATDALKTSLWSAPVQHIAKATEFECVFTSNSSSIAKGDPTSPYVDIGRHATPASTVTSAGSVTFSSATQSGRSTPNSSLGSYITPTDFIESIASSTSGTTSVFGPIDTGENMEGLETIKDVEDCDKCDWDYCDVPEIFEGEGECFQDDCDMFLQSICEGEEDERDHLQPSHVSEKVNVGGTINLKQKGYRGASELAMSLNTLRMSTDTISEMKESTDTGICKNTIHGGDSLSMNVISET